MIRDRHVADPGARLSAVLGPTNTGKTHLAVERMLGHASGMIGLPLRLLAREVYDRVVARAGSGAAALITGEERIVPARPRYFVCTVEAMPLDRPVAFLAVDEVQLAADPERGHVFTQRILHARGREETMLLGAETARPLLRRLLPGIVFVSRPRFSRLSHAGVAKLGRLPPRSAVVAFSAAEVYAIADFLRRHKGGAAVVLGALSPRTRNAQVALYQAGEVDYLVATDAIGMGLNMDVNHVAFAALRKFDGRHERALKASEVAQIAGRAGRHMNDGTFGTTTEAGALDAEIVAAVEDHAFAPLTAFNWRSTRLRFTTLKALLASLDAAPPGPDLIRAPETDDDRALRALAADPEIAALADGPDRLRLLWDVCRIPDYRKVMADHHARLLAEIYRRLAGGGGRLDEDWLAARIGRLDHIDGDIDTLSTRIAHVRTWTYVAHRPAWLADAGHWRERTRVIEARLSDALHERLTQSFVDRRTAALVGGLKRDRRLDTVVGADGAVAVEGHFIGRLDGFRFIADRAEATYEGKALWNAAKRALKGEIATRITAFENAPERSIALDAGAGVTWRGARVGRLRAGTEPLRPRVEPLASEFLDRAQRARIGQRLDTWLAAYLGRVMGPLQRARAAGLSGPARGLVHQLGEALGTVSRRSAAAELGALGPADRKALGRLGIVIGREAIFLRALLRPRAVAARALLWAVHAGVSPPPAPPPPGRVAVAADPAWPAGFAAAIGYRVFAGRAVRVDIVERIAERAWRAARAGPFAPDPALAAIAGSGVADLAAILIGLGFRPRPADGAGVVRYAAPKRARRGKPAARPAVDGDSPFAKLAVLREAS